MSEDAIRVSPGRPVGSSGHTRDNPLDKLPLALIVLALLSVLILIAAQIDDGFGAPSAWLYVTILGAAYILSRGLAHHHHGSQH